MIPHAFTESNPQLPAALTTISPTLHALLTMDPAPFFRLSHSNDTHTFGDPNSNYSDAPVDKNLTFDISNNHCLINQAPDGSLRQASFYQQNHSVDHSWPGIWVQAEREQSGNMDYLIRLNGQKMTLDGTSLGYETCYIDGAIPLTTSENDDVRVQFFSFAPISRNGERRLRLGVYGAHMENVSKQSKSLEVTFPTSSLDQVWLVNGRKIDSPQTALQLTAGKSVDLVTCIFPKNNAAEFDTFSLRSTAEWLQEVMCYYRGLTGDLTMTDDPFTAALFKRSIIQCANCITLDSDEEISVINFGSYPAGKGVNMKDSIYPFYALAASNSSLTQKGILYLLKNAVRKKGTQEHKCPWGHTDTGTVCFEGGVSHSLGNTVGAIMLAGLYYRYTADKSFFLSNPDVKDQMYDLLEAVIATREDEDIWLFPSKFISDGYSLGDYHTGSNTCAWFAFSSFSRILEEVYNDRENAERYRDIAARIKNDILDRCIVDGPYGTMFNEGVNKDGQPPFLFHDGEETDTTLFSFYDFLPYDDQRLRNYLRFAFTPANPGYHPESKGIIWQRYPEDAPIRPYGNICSYATFPAYITRLATTENKETMIGPGGAMSLIRSLTDVNGALWWWPYSKDITKTTVEREIGQSGWATAILVSLMQSDFFGVLYDAPTRTLTFRPFSPSSGFEWRNIRFGDTMFHVSYDMTEGSLEACITNPNQFSVTLKGRFSAVNNQRPVFTIDTKPVQVVSEPGAFLGKPVVNVSVDLPPCSTLNVNLMNT